MSVLFHFMKMKFRKSKTKRKRINRNSMIIGLDAKRAMANHTGLGNYSRYMVDILATYHQSNNYRLFVPKEKKNSSFDKLLHHNNVRSSFPQSTTMKRLKKTLSGTVYSYIMD